MKIAVCFSGQLRFVKEYSEYILKNLIHLYDVDVYAHIYYDESMLGKPFHHEFNDLYKENINDFLEIYNPKKIKIESEYKRFDDNIYNFAAIEPDLINLNYDDIKNAIFRMESQWYSVAQTYDLIDEPEKYDFILRLRTDSYIKNPILFNNLNKNILYVQSGTAAGADRKYCDWFAAGNNIVMKYYMKNMIDEFKKIYSNGLIHMHNFIEYSLLDMKIECTNYEFHVPINHMFYIHRKT
jgi:hypothetical protein